MRDEFSPSVKEALAKRVGLRCSNPDCRQLTSGPQVDPSGSINVGVAAHITAASPGGPRYDETMSSGTRAGADNGIWLCQKCAKLVDSDSERYSVTGLKEWKASAEAEALHELEGRASVLNGPEVHDFRKIGRLMPELLAEMRADLARNPVAREFVLLTRRGTYWSKGHELVYYHEDHDNLRSKIQILENLNLVYEITYNNTDRFIITEELADYLSNHNSAEA